MFFPILKALPLILLFDNVNIMSKRKVQFVKNNIYHIYNRGVHKNDLYLSDADYQRWEKLLAWSANYSYSYSLYLQRLLQIEERAGETEAFIKSFAENYKYSFPLVEILAYVEMPNHYHLILEQTEDDGISRFMQKLSTAYAMYFNERYDVSGSLFQSKFQAVEVITDEQLVQLLRYVLNNPLNAKLVKSNYMIYKWSSLSEYTGEKQSEIISTKRLPSFFSDRQKLINFLNEEPTESNSDILVGL